MKRCPKCNQVFDEEWLSFCTKDGTSLIDTSALPSEPPPTMMSPPLPPSVSPSEQPTINLQTNQPAPCSPPVPMQQSWQPAPPPMQSGWQPPPPPAYVKTKKQGLAIASMILGILSFPGFCFCYVGGVPLGLTAIILGIVSLVQIKNDPDNNGGKPFSIVGVVLGGLYFVLVAFVILMYGVAILTQGIK